MTKRSSEQRRIPCAVVGYGYWGPNLARVLTEHRAFELISICDKSPKCLERISERYPLLRTPANFNDILLDRSIEAVAIATPVGSHYALVRQALENDKHVLVEKPLCTSVPEARRLIALARRKKRVLAVGHTFLYSPPVLKIHQMLLNKELGELFYVDSSRVNLGLFQPDVDVFWDLGPHEVSIALLWLGKDPVRVRAIGTSHVRRRIAEAGYLTMEFPGGVMYQSHLSWLAPVKLRRTSLVGSEKMVVYNDAASDERVKVYHRGVVKNPETFGEFQLTYRSGDVVSPKIDTVEPLHSQCDAWAKAITQGGPLRSGGEFGLRVVRVLEAAQQSLRRNGMPVTLRHA
ncbi:MAG: Gfo/Idh/MocA family oxidoreductase [Elusimicrobiota bacterium]|jgi:predicted dehydrogenase